MRRPDIFWIVTTQWRAQATGYGGDPNARTPWLDGLASESVNYRQAVTPHPMGPQARAALLTGQLSPANGVSDYQDPLPIAGDRPGSQGRTLAHALGDRGYDTAFFGKWHLAPRDASAAPVGEAHARTFVPPERRGGFTFWEGFEGGFLINDPWLHGTRLQQPTLFKGYQSDVLVERAARWIAARATRIPDRPLFCMVSLEAPHPPYDAPVPHVTPPAPEALSLRANVPVGGECERKARRELSGYHAHIEATDRALGRFFAEVGLTDAFLVFTSVHGDMHGSHGVFRKAWPYEESVRVPLLVRHPPRDRRDEASHRGSSDDPVSLVDLPHMAVAWAERREWECTRDSSAISMPAAPPFPAQCPVAWRGFRSPRHKFVVRENGEPWLYFDLVRDPLEQVNLVGAPGRGAEIRDLARWL